MTRPKPEGPLMSPSQSPTPEPRKTSALASRQIAHLAGIWNTFWFPEGPPHALALIRIGLGSFILMMWLKFLPHVTTLFSTQGLFFPYVDESLTASPLTRLIGYIVGSASPLQAWFCYLSLLISIVGFTLGAFYRVSTTLYLIFLIYHYYAYTYHATYSYDKVLFIISWVMLASPAANVLSVDAWLARRKNKRLPTSVPLWTQRIICVQLALMYFGTGVAKVTSPFWHSGEVLEQALISEWSSPLGYWLSRLDPPMGLLNAATAIAILFELYAGYFIFQRRWQLLVMASGFFFHFLNATILVVWQFLFVPLLYILFFDPGTVARKVENILGRSATDIKDMGECWWDPITTASKTLH